MEEDLNKVKKKVDELKGMYPGTEWIPAEGFHALTVVYQESGNPKLIFDPSSGLIVKSFINTKTGEVKTFYWQKVAIDD